MAAVMLASKTTGQPDPFPGRGAQSPVADAWDEVLHQLAGRMMSMGFSQTQVCIVVLVDAVCMCSMFVVSVQRSCREDDEHGFLSDASMCCSAC